ncbi:MAG: hypothetical protein Q4F41_03385 [Eubacteriales bacterium]|nr:hypothetical protein [Eubacteriales bacterium]
MIYIVSLHPFASIDSKASWPFSIPFLLPFGPFFIPASLWGFLSQRFAHLCRPWDFFRRRAKPGQSFSLAEIVTILQDKTRNVHFFFPTNFAEKGQPRLGAPLAPFPPFYLRAKKERLCSVFTDSTSALFFRILPLFCPHSVI